MIGENMFDLVARIIGIIIVVSLVRAVTSRMRRPVKGSDNGVINLPNIAPILLLIATLFTVIMVAVSMDRKVFADIFAAMPLLVFTVIMDILFVLFSLPSINWYLWPKENEIVIRSWLNKVSHYPYDGITARQGKSELYLYFQGKKIASLTDNLPLDSLMNQLSRHNITIENVSNNNSRKAM